MGGRKREWVRGGKTEGTEKEREGKGRERKGRVGGKGERKVVMFFGIYKNPSDNAIVFSNLFLFYLTRCSTPRN